MPEFTVADTDFAERVRHSFGRQGLMAHLCAVMTKVEPGVVEIEMPFTDELTQQHGFYHAGGIAAVVDTAGGFAGSTLFAADDGVLTVN